MLGTWKVSPPTVTGTVSGAMPKEVVPTTGIPMPTPVVVVAPIAGIIGGVASVL
jgi:hypothetical protein